MDVSKITQTQSKSIIDLKAEAYYTLVKLENSHKVFSEYQKKLVDLKKKIKSAEAPYGSE